jgi:hydrogenase maturation factor
MTGALSASPGAPTGHCITCADAAEPMRVVSLETPDGLARCRGCGGGECTVQTALVGPVSVGQRLLVHAGTALAVLRDEAVSR